MWRAKLTALILASALALSLCACSKSAEKTAVLLADGTSSAGAANYRTATAKEGDLIKTSELSMEPVYSLSQTLRCEESGLYFDFFSVKRGDTVKEGTLIATFTRKGSEADLESARLDLQRAREAYDAQVETLSQAVEDAKAQGDIYVKLAQLDLDQYEYEQGRELDRLEEEYEEAKASFDDEYLYAPFDCVVYSLASLEQGAEVARGKELAELKVADSLLLYGTTSAKNFLYNMDVQIEYGRKDERTTVGGRVVCNDAVLPEGVAGDGNTYIKVDGDLTEDDLNKPTAGVSTVQAKNALLVPRGAVEVEDGRYFVSVLDGDMVKKRFIIRGITGGTVGENAVVVLAGLKSGQTVILN